MLLILGGALIAIEKIRKCTLKFVEAELGCDIDTSMRDLVLLAVLEDELLVGHGVLDVPGSLVLLPLIVNPGPCDLVVELVELEVDGVLVVVGVREELVVHAVDGDVDEHI